MSIIDDSYFNELDPGTNIDQDDEVTPTNVGEFLKEAELDLTQDLSEPPVCLEIKNRDKNTIFATLGNFSLVIGKAKSRKTFFVTLTLAAAMKNGELLDKFISHIPDEDKMVLLFDTEQSPYHAQRTAKRVCRLDKVDMPKNFKAYSLRKYPPRERLMIIEHAILNTPELYFVVIDGIRDLVNSINDEVEATFIVSKLLKWTQEQNIHMLVVLHQNKGNEFARGHLGTELVNKGEIVLTVTPDPSNDKASIINAEYCRDISPDPFGIAIDEQALPFIVNVDQKPASMALSPTSIPLEEHKSVLYEVFRKSPKPSHGELLVQLKLAFQGQGRPMGDNKARVFIQYYLNERHITAIGKERSPNRYYNLSWVDSDG